MPTWLRCPRGKLARYFADAALGYFIGRKVVSKLTGRVVAVISHGPVGWYPLHWPVPTAKRVHFYHGTYWGVAEAVRPFIRYRGYMKYKWWDAMVLERLSGRGKLCVANSEQSSEEVRRLFGYDCRTVWLPMDTSRFRPRDKAGCQRLLKLPEKGFIGLFVGSLEPHKGFPVVRALVLLFPQVHWVLVLRDVLPDDLKSRHNVTVLQDVPDEDLPLVYSAADFCVCPSRYEPFGYVVAEALACGTPVIAAPTGASRLFLKDPPLDRLLIADPEDVEAFGSAVLEVLANRSCFHRAVVERLGPELLLVMGPEAWWTRFQEATGV